MYHVELNPKVSFRVVRRVAPRRPSTRQEDTPKCPTGKEDTHRTPTTPRARSNRHLCDTDSSTRRKRAFDAEGSDRLGWYCQCPHHHSHDGILEGLRRGEGHICQPRKASSSPVREEPRKINSHPHLSTFRVDSDDDAPEPSRPPQEPTPSKEPRWEGLFHMAAHKRDKQRALEEEARLSKEREEEALLDTCSIHKGKRITQASLERLSTPRRRVAPGPEPHLKAPSPTGHSPAPSPQPLVDTPRCDAESWLHAVEEPTNTRHSSMSVSSHRSDCLFDDIMVEQPIESRSTSKHVEPLSVGDNKDPHLSLPHHAPSRATSPGEASWGGLSEAH